MRSKEKAFWYKGSKALLIDEYELVQFLTFHNWGQFQLTKERTSSKSLFHNNNGILELHNSITLKNWIIKHLAESNDENFEKKGKYYQTDVKKREILSKLQAYPTSNLESKVTTSLPIFSEKGFKGTTKLNLFDDKADTAHIRFRNGILKVTSNGFKLYSYEELQTEGAVWEASIIDNDFEFDDTKGLFEIFAEKAFHNKNLDNDEYTLDLEQYQSMRASYGFMIHTHFTPDVTKCVYFIDKDSELGRPEGGNGKSLIMESVEQFKSLLQLDGGQFQKNLLSGHFPWQGVTLETRFVMIDEIKPEFSFDLMFSPITNKWVVEQKFKDQFVIPKDRKPKIGITTNYVIAGSGTSYSRRQHIVEFGNYWNHVNKRNEQPSDKKHLGKMLFDDFDQDDWNQFYSYGVKCLMHYFKHNLHEASNKSHLVKSRKMEIEGKDGDGVVSDWMEKYCDKIRLQYQDGISIDDLYKLFENDCPMYTPRHKGNWDLKRFYHQFYRFVDLNERYEYNAHKAHKGNTKSAKRDQKGPAGSQVDWIKITVHPDHLTTLDYFEKLANS